MEIPVVEVTVAAAVRSGLRWVLLTLATLAAGGCAHTSAPPAAPPDPAVEIRVAPVPVRLALFYWPSAPGYPRGLSAQSAVGAAAAAVVLGESSVGHESPGAMLPFSYEECDQPCRQSLIDSGFAAALHITLIREFSVEREAPNRILAMVEIEDLRTRRVALRRLRDWRRADPGGDEPESDNARLSAAIRRDLAALITPTAQRDAAGVLTLSAERLGEEEQTPDLYLSDLEEGRATARAAVDLHLIASTPGHLARVVVAGAYGQQELALATQAGTASDGADPGGQDSGEHDGRGYIERIARVKLRPGHNAISVKAFNATDELVQERHLRVDRIAATGKASSAVLLAFRPEDGRPQDAQSPFPRLGVEFLGHGVPTIRRGAESEPGELKQSLRAVGARSDAWVPGLAYFAGVARIQDEGLVLLVPTRTGLPGPRSSGDHGSEVLRLPQDLAYLGPAGIFLVDACDATDPEDDVSEQFSVLASATSAASAAARPVVGSVLAGSEAVARPLLIMSTTGCEAGRPSPLLTAVGRTLRAFGLDRPGTARSQNARFLSMLKADYPALMVAGGTDLEASLVSVLEPLRHWAESDTVEASPPLVDNLLKRFERVRSARTSSKQRLATLKEMQGYATRVFRAAMLQADGEHPIATLLDLRRHTNKQVASLASALFRQWDCRAEVAALLTSSDGSARSLGADLILRMDREEALDILKASSDISTADLLAASESGAGTYRLVPVEGPAGERFHVTVSWDPDAALTGNCLAESDWGRSAGLPSPAEVPSPSAAVVSRSVWGDQDLVLGTARLAASCGAAYSFGPE